MSACIISMYSPTGVVVKKRTCFGGYRYYYKCLVDESDLNSGYITRVPGYTWRRSSRRQTRLIDMILSTKGKTPEGKRDIMRVLSGASLRGLKNTTSFEKGVIAGP